MKRLIFISLCLALSACSAVPPAKAPAPPSATTAREVAQSAQASFTAAYLDAWLARVPDLTRPEQITALLQLLRAANPATPAEADAKTAQATVDRVAKGDLVAAQDATKEATARAAAAEAALAKERDARAKAEAELQAERERHTQEVADLKAKWSNNLRLWIARGLAAAGVLVILASGALIWALGFTAWKKVAGGVAFGLLLIGCGLFVGSVYFWPAFWITIGVGAVVAFFVYRHTRQTSLIEQGARRAIQDGKDEAAAGIDAAKSGYAWLVEHLQYRFPRKGDQKNPIESVIDQRNAAEGINAA